MLCETVLNLDWFWVSFCVKCWNKIPIKHNLDDEKPCQVLKQNANQTQFRRWKIISSETNTAPVFPGLQSWLQHTLVLDLTNIWFGLEYTLNCWDILFNSASRVIYHLHIKNCLFVQFSIICCFNMSNFIVHIHDEKLVCLSNSASLVWFIIYIWKRRPFKSGDWTINQATQASPFYWVMPLNHYHSYHCHNTKKTNTKTKTKSHINTKKVKF